MSLHDIAQRRVLVVDDDRHILELVLTRLQVAGCVTAVARDGYEAQKRLWDFRPEAMVLDLNMPGLDGFGVLSWMSRHGMTETVRTMVLTARNGSGDVARAVELGARDYLAKPFHTEQLLRRVARLLARPRSAAA